MHLMHLMHLMHGVEQSITHPWPGSVTQGRNLAA
jgi:hypothetical protein